MLYIACIVIILYLLHIPIVFYISIASTIYLDYNLLGGRNMITTWQDLLNHEKKKPYFSEIMLYLEHSETRYYPPNALIYNALDQTPLEKVKVVILGQDPYHGPNEAHGLSFSVPHGIKIPPSLNNIYKELSNDINCNIPKHGDLTTWAHQGVLLLNSSLTVTHKEPGSHSKIGWQILTDKIISVVSEQQPFVVFILWGKHAQSKKPLIDSRHYILESVHPSPLSAHRGFFGCNHFSKTNTALIQNQLETIDWEIRPE